MTFTGIPLQQNCDPEKPEEHLLWGMVGLAGPTSHAPLILPIEVMQKWSEHLYMCGFRHVPEEQKVKYVPPTGTTNWVHGAAGEWVFMDEELTPDQSAPDTSHLSTEEKAVLLARLKQELGEE